MHGVNNQEDRHRHLYRRENLRSITTLVHVSSLPNHRIGTVDFSKFKRYEGEQAVSSMLFTEMEQLLSAVMAPIVGSV
jgi:hypothetical protein